MKFSVRWIGPAIGLLGLLSTTIQINAQTCSQGNGKNIALSGSELSPPVARLPIRRSSRPGLN